MLPTKINFSLKATVRMSDHKTFFVKEILFVFVQDKDFKIVHKNVNR